MELKQGLWKYIERMNVLIYNGDGFYCEEDLLHAINTLTQDRGWPISNMAGKPLTLKLPSHFIFNN